MAQSKKKNSKIKKTMSSKSSAKAKNASAGKAKSSAKALAKSSAKSAMKSSSKATAKVKVKVTAKMSGKKPTKIRAKGGLKKVPTKAKSNKAVSAKSLAPKNSLKSNSFNWDEFLTPLDDRLVVEMNSHEKTTTSGLIIIPDTVADTSGNLKAKVLVVGRGHLEKNGKIRPMDVKAGDTVVFSSYAGSKIDIAGQEVMILRESDILGIVGK